MEYSLCGVCWRRKRREPLGPLTYPHALCLRATHGQPEAAEKPGACQPGRGWTQQEPTAFVVPPLESFRTKKQTRLLWRWGRTGNTLGTLRSCPPTPPELAVAAPGEPVPSADETGTAHKCPLDTHEGRGLQRAGESD